jgi:putative copper export protein
MNFFAVLNHWVHLCSVIFWMGGVAFQLLVIAPFITKENPPPAYLITISNRFQKIISPLLLILLVTGGVNLGFRRAGHETIPPDYITALAFKLLLVATVVSIHFFSFIRSNLNDTTLADQKTQILSQYRYAKWTLAIGIIIIFIAAMLRQWKFL